MPNLSPPITTVAAALEYKARLQPLAPDVRFLMTLYLHPSLTPKVIAEAAATKEIFGVKAYPAGVTTGSDSGVLDWERFYPIFEAMQEHDLVLNLHGEVPSSSSSTFEEQPVSVLNAEPLFLPMLHTLHARFPRLRIVLEHATTAAALEAVSKCEPNVVACTVTAHHLWLTTDDVVGDAWNFCKPVAKSENDRRALMEAVLGVGEVGHRLRGRCFFGSDSAPHAMHTKSPLPGQKAPAGCFTQPYASALVVAAIEEALEQNWLQNSLPTDFDSEALLGNLRGFLCEYGRKFYGVEDAGFEGVGSGKGGKVVLERRGEKIQGILRGQNGDEEMQEVEVAVFGGGREVRSLKWLD